MMGNHDQMMGENHSSMTGDHRGDDMSQENRVTLTPPTDFNAQAAKHLIEMDTKNVTRLQASDPVTMAVQVSQTVWPATHRQNRPGTIILAPAHQWRMTLASADLIHHPNNGPILLTKNGRLPEVTWREIQRLQPKGNPNGIELMVVGELSKQALKKLSSYQIQQIEAETWAEFAQKIDEIYARASGGKYPAGVIIVSQAESAKKFSLTAANWIAHMPEPLLYVKKNKIPPATKEALQKRNGKARLYVLGPEKIISQKVVNELKKYGSVTRIAGDTPIETSIAFAKFKDKETGFGWGLQEPGHGLVFVSTETPAFALVGAPFAHLGKHAPLIWLKNGKLTEAHYNFLSLLKPTFVHSPTEGPYNHAYLLGSVQDVSFRTQGIIDSALEIVSAGGAGHGAGHH